MNIMSKKRKNAAQQPAETPAKKRKSNSEGSTEKSNFTKLQKSKKKQTPSQEDKIQKTNEGGADKGQSKLVDVKQNGSHLRRSNVNKKKKQIKNKTDQKLNGKERPASKSSGSKSNLVSDADSKKHIPEASASKEPSKKDIKSRTSDSHTSDQKAKITGGRKKWKKKKKRKSSEDANEKKLIQAVSRVPRKAAHASANWKQLLAKLEAENESNPSKKKKKDDRRNRQKKNDAKKETETEQDNKGAPDIWFDDVDEILLETMKEKQSLNSKINPLVKPESYQGLTKVLAMDCEMVGVGAGGKDSILARVSIVNQYGQCVLDRYVTPTEEVTDYRTAVSGIRKEDLTQYGDDFKSVQEEVGKILKGRLVVGHAIMNDFKVLFLDHPKKKIRDTSRYKPFRKLFNGKTPSLKKLTDKLLGVSVQEGEHNSVQDAQAAMRIYTLTRKQWERDIKGRKNLT